MENELDKEKARPVTFILRKKADGHFFNEILAGDAGIIREYKEVVIDQLSKGILDLS